MTEIEEIRQALLAGNHMQAWALYQIHQATTEHLTADAHHLGGRAAMLSGNLYGARQAFERAIAAGAAGETLGRVRLLLGECLRRTGNLAEAESMLRLFLDGMSDYPDLGSMWRAGGLINLALTYRQRRRLDDARRAYQDAAAECRQEGLRLYLGYALRNLAWVCCLLGDAEGAKTALDEAEGFCDGAGDRSHQLLGGAFAATVAGDRAEAMDLCRRIFAANDSPDGPPVDVLAHAAWLIGREALRKGDLTMAEQMAHQAVDLGQRCGGELRAMLDGADLLREVRRRRYEMEHQTAGA